jgi:hypothetical protein
MTRAGFACLALLVAAPAAQAQNAAPAAQAQNPAPASQAQNAAPAAQAQNPAPAAQAQNPPPASQAQSLAVTGMVAHPGPIGLAALKQVQYRGSFNSMSGRQTHSWTGPLLRDVLDRATLTDEPGKRTHIRHVILATGADGYAAAIAIGEIDPKGENKPIMVALTQDGAPMKAPRLVVPGDASLTRRVHDLVSLDVR